LQVAGCRLSGGPGTRSVPLRCLLLSIRRSFHENTFARLGRCRGSCPCYRRHGKRGHARCQTYRGSFRPAPGPGRPWARARTSRLARQSRPASRLVRRAPSRMVALPASPLQVRPRIGARLRD
jgi:hypothetical protein